MKVKEAIEFLGVSDNPNIKEVDNAFREKVKIHYPPKGGKQEDFEKCFEARNLLYDFLKPTTSLLVIQQSIEKQQDELLNQYKEIYLERLKQSIIEKERNIKRDITSNGISKVILISIPFLIVIIVFSIVWPEFYSLLWRFGLGIWLFITANWTYLAWAHNRMVNYNIRRLKEQEIIEKLYIDIADTKKLFIPLTLFRKIISEGINKHIMFRGFRGISGEEEAFYIDIIVTNLVEWGYIEKGTQGNVPGFYLKKLISE